MDIASILDGFGRSSHFIVRIFNNIRGMGPRFDSHRPLQILKDLRSRTGFHYFQNINFVAKLHGKFGANVVERNLSGVAFGHGS